MRKVNKISFVKSDLISINKSIVDYIIKAILFSALFLYTMNIYAQDIGGADNPLQYSIHTYSIKMGSALNTGTWNIYDNGATRTTIENGTSLPKSNTVDYKIVSARTGKQAGIDSITIDFTGDLTPGTSYQLVYKEVSSSECKYFEFYPFTLQNPIDIDLDPSNLVNANDCPDSVDKYIEGTGALVVPQTYTTVSYHVVFVSPVGAPNYNPASPPSSGRWSFNYSVQVVGQSGPSSIIESITYPSFTATPGTTTYNGSVSVVNGTTDLDIQVTYRDVPSVQQKIDFKLSQIQGSYEEVDVDIALGNQATYEKEHFVSSMPGPSYIIALD